MKPAYAQKASLLKPVIRLLTISLLVGLIPGWPLLTIAKDYPISIIPTKKTKPRILTASWYSRESCLKESGKFIMANGKELRDDQFTCASWDFKFGTKLKVINARTGKSVIVTVTDRGPAKRLYRQGRIIDLAKRAFMQIASLEQGIVEVRIED